MKAYYDMPSSSVARCMVMSLVMSWLFIKSMMNGTRAKAMGTPVRKTLASCIKRCTMGDEGAGGGDGRREGVCMCKVCFSSLTPTNY